MALKDTQDTYNRIAEEFSRTRAFLWDDLLPFGAYAKSGSRVLDVGCGNGRLCRLFVGLDVSYTGIDQSEALIVIAKKKFPDAEFLVANMTGLPFPDRSFDVVYCIAAFHHLPDETMRIKALEEMKRVGKGGAKIVMMNWNLRGEEVVKRLERLKKLKKLGESNFFVSWKNGKKEVLGERYYHAFTFEELSGLFAKVGLNVEEQYFMKRGERSDDKNGENMVSVVVKASG